MLNPPIVQVAIEERPLYPLHIPEVKLFDIGLPFIIPGASQDMLFDSYKKLSRPMIVANANQGV